MPDIEDQDDVQDQVVAQADDEDFDDEDDFDDDDDSDVDDDDSDDADYDEVAVLAEIEQAEKNHKNAVAQYNQVMADIHQRQVDSIKQLVKAGRTVADIAKVYPRKLVVANVADKPAA